MRAMSDSFQRALISSNCKATALGDTSGYRPTPRTESLRVEPLWGLKPEVSGPSNVQDLKMFTLNIQGQIARKVSGPGFRDSGMPAGCLATVEE